MITLIKLDEPKILSDNYQIWTDELKLHQLKEKEKGKKIRSYIKSKYSHKDIKDQLKKETFKKCAYCESKFLATGFGDIEHVIPKTHDSDMWFKWENLTIGCQVCNNNKGSYYDINLPILDPYVDDIDEHIFFAGSFLVGRTQKGSHTIRLLKLNRIELLEARERYLSKTIQPFIELIVSHSNQALKQIVLTDLIELTREFNEFSKMASTVVSQFNDPTKSAS